MPSLNFRMGEMNAQIGLDQLSKLEIFKKKRLKLVKYYIKNLKYSKITSKSLMTKIKIFFGTFL